MSIITEETCRATLQKIIDSLGKDWEGPEKYIDCISTDCDSCALDIDNIPLYNKLYDLFFDERESPIVQEDRRLDAVAYSRGALELVLDEGAELAIRGDIPLDKNNPKTKKKMDLLEKACGGLDDVHKHPPAVHVHIDNCPLDKFLKVAKKL